MTNILSVLTYLPKNNFWKGKNLSVAKAKFFDSFQMISFYKCEISKFCFQNMLKSILYINIRAKSFKKSKSCIWKKYFNLNIKKKNYQVELRQIILLIHFTIGQMMQKRRVRKSCVLYYIVVWSCLIKQLQTTVLFLIRPTGKNF